MEYPSNVNTSVYRDDQNKKIERFAGFTYSGKWKDAFKMLDKDKSLVNMCRLPKVNDSAKLYTPLHQAAYLKAPEEVFQKLLSYGASRSLKNAEGQTAYDIAKEKNLPDHILKSIEVPEEITKNAEEIKRMEGALHGVILGRAKSLIEKNGQSLPQLAYLYEFGDIWYPIGGMYGGFSITKHEKGIETSSWCRVAGGSGQRHVIDRQGNVELVEEGFD